MSLAELATPALLLDVAKVRHNLARLKARLAEHGVAFRPHMKTAKSAALYAEVIGTGTPITVSTLKEAEEYAAAGATDVTYAVGITPDKLDRVGALRRSGCAVAVILDSVPAAEAVAAWSRAHGDALPAFVEIDADGQRAGLQARRAAEIVAVGRALVDGGAELRGVLTHAGDSYAVPGAAAIAAMAETERAATVAAAEALRAAGLPCPVVSVGSTPTALFARDLTGVTEVRAGVFMFQDLVMAGLGVCPVEDIALSVLASVIGHQADKGWTLIDAGWMAMSRDRGTAALPVDQGYGLVCDAGGRPLGDHVVIKVSQEHGIVAARAGGAAKPLDLPLGARVRVLPNHACATAAQFQDYVLVEGGRVVGRAARFNGW